MLGHYPIHAIKAKVQEFDTPVRMALWMRRKALAEFIIQLEKTFMEEIWLPAEFYYMSQDLHTAKAEITDIDRALALLDEVRKDEITDEMIRTARDYPIDKLIDFSKGRTICMFHNSKDNDLSHDKKHNRAKCFGQCNKSWDSISVVMFRDGISFIQAVRQLQI